MCKMAKYENGLVKKMDTMSIKTQIECNLKQKFNVDENMDTK